MSDPRYAPWLRRAWTDPLSSLADDPCPAGHPTPHRRLVRALASRGAVTLGAADFVSLVRAVVRLETVAAWGAPVLEVPQSLVRALAVGADDWSAASLSATEVGASLRVVARPWSPPWLVGAASNSPDTPLYEDRLRRTDPTVPADPMVSRLLGFENYQSEAQRQALRTVLAAPPGATVVIDLPTGSGKTLCGLLPALLPGPDGLPGVTPFVVPTVALALDLERRARRPDDADYRAAYRPEEGESARLVRLRCERGLQGPVFVSPESLAGSLRPPLREAARAGRIRAVVVDEAHMVGAWGDEFRPAFQQIAAVRRELLRLATEAGRPAFVTVLMSATLTEHRLRHLSELFGGTGPIHIAHAVRLRPEPAYWVAEAATEDDRHAWLLEAVRHLPRPLILYTVKRAHAERWHRRLVEAGFLRVGLMHGGTEADRRRQLLRSWDSDEVDVVVATSAFGLGVDKQDVRAVLHAALPEGVDRFYQEVGRGGRDGFASLSLLVWGRWDWRAAVRLMSPTLIGAERGRQRWEAMFRRPVFADPASNRYRVCLSVRPSLGPGDIDMDGEEHEKWNLRTLLLMARAGVLELTWDETPPDPAKETEDSTPGEITVRLQHHGDHLEPSMWERVIEPCRQRALEPASTVTALLRRLLNGRECVSAVLADCYRSRDPDIPTVTACGGCPHCRATGVSPFAGRLRCRHTPAEPWPALPIGDRLRDFLGERPCGLLFYPPHAEEGALWGDLSLVAGWLIEEGVLVLAAPTAFLARFQAWFDVHTEAAAFLDSGVPSGVLARQAAAVIVRGPGGPFLAEVWPHVGGPKGRLIVLLSEDSREPGHATRLVRDMWTGPKLTLDRWKDLYLE
jgi:superfamily II DNA helicase RecQ